MLKKTDYDNFKNLTFFVSEHRKANEIMNDVNAFYRSFLESKLIRLSEFDKYPNLTFLLPDQKHKLDLKEFYWTTELAYGNAPIYVPNKHKVNRYDDFIHKLITKAKKNDIWFVIDSDGNPIEFAPVSDKVEPTFDISDDGGELIVSCEYFLMELFDVYDDFGRQQSACSQIQKVRVSLYFDINTGNFIRRETHYSNRKYPKNMVNPRCYLLKFDNFDEC